MHKNLVVIPIRGGSKRVPNKNSRLLGGIPLFVHRINYAKENATICTKIVVSTDSEVLKELALKEGVQVILRPKHLAADNTPTKEVLRHVVENLEENFDNIILLQATNPFRRKELLSEAFKAYVKGDFNSLMTVTENKQKFGKIVNNTFVPFNYEFGQRSQDLEPLFFENGLLYISKSSLIVGGEIIGEKNLPFIENHPSAMIDIDEEVDFEKAMYYLEKKNRT
ncbi:cytidylyltransferase domain-containing protein [Polaribacter tangerinus]|uniref:acylneuraminate cytidylyltransferase family protein n=1 Tax=Polaribacter tangerinus TaxID=1920034 RepID=UPI000B4BA600|nr:acylneuraminate cytidylyltransferase family protein [Polaribacter tangerinus]